ncbi:MAG: SDR family oxidoreductase [Thermoproteales archaeon]|nr:SDR family oxidoreductase [Thermoproteales archaeon]
MKIWRLKIRVPIGRVGKPEEVAEAVLSLVKNDFITGAVFVVDGGYIL